MTPSREPGATPGFHAIILAAGASRRMGRDKTRLPWISGQPLLRVMFDALTAAGWTPCVVLNPENFPRWKSELPSAVRNEHPDAGKTGSLAIGASHVPADARAILVTAVDQPRPRAIYAALRDAVERHPGKILVPDRNGRRGHPVVVPGALRQELMTLDERVEGLRGLLHTRAVDTIRISGLNPKALAWDLNTRADYEAARRWFENAA